MDGINHDDHIGSDFRRELTKNAAAQTVFDALTPEDREKLMDRVRRTGSPAEYDRIIDSLAGWQKGHAPYQL